MSGMTRARSIGFGPGGSWLMKLIVGQRTTVATGKIVANEMIIGDIQIVDDSSDLVGIPRRIPLSLTLNQLSMYVQPVNVSTLLLQRTTLGLELKVKVLHERLRYHREGVLRTICTIA
jgi:hypothetical protein